ncbi:MAG: hypothetical protein KAQ97_09620 [Candidatus Fermentibacteraceae bacterium]|nr:hypothetical protein [Candidatus Fermentibacteraceae bacterium]
MTVLLIFIILLSGVGDTKPIASDETNIFYPIPLLTPPFNYTLNESALKFLSLELIESVDNRVIDYEDWFENIIWPAETYHNGGVNDAIRGYYPPTQIPDAIPVPGDYSFHLSMIIYGEEKIIAFYGSPPNRFDVVLDPRILIIMGAYTYQPEMVLDFLTYTHSPGDVETDRDFVFQGLKWAEVEGGILYVSTAHRTYSSSSNGLNAYITALDLETRQILWRSQPLVSNSENFLIEGETIITGYGFTNENDYVYLLNRITGEVMDSYQVPSAPGYFYRQDDHLYVRCYDSNCVFSIYY